MRPFIALVRRWHGLAQKNFYNQLVGRYGFEDAAEMIQELYLDVEGEAAGAIPAELIDLVTMCGPIERVRERFEVYRAAGVGTLIASGMRPSHTLAGARFESWRRCSDPPAHSDRRFGDPGHAFPAIALGRELARRGTR